MAEVVTVNITEQTLFNLTISDDSNSATVSVPNEIATVQLSLQDLNLELVNADPASEGQLFKASSGNFYTLRSLKDDNKTIEISQSSNGNNIEFKLPDAGISTPDNFKLNADSDSSANITLSGGSVDLNKAKLTTDFDANSKDINAVSTIRSTTGNITTINATTINTSDLNVSDDLVITDDLTVGGTVAVTENVTVTGDVTAANMSATTNITAGDIDTDTGTIDTLDGVTSTFTNVNGTNGAITTLSGTTSTYTTANATNVNTTNLVASGDVQGATGTITTLDGTTATYGTVNGTTVNTTNVIASGDVDASTGTIDTLDGTTATITTINSTTANTTNLIASGDVDASTGTIDTLDGTTATITTVNATDLNVSDDLVVTDDASVGGDLTVTGTATITTGAITTVNATTVNATNLSLTGDISADDASLGGNVTIGGNLTVSGTTTTVNTETIELADNNIVLNSNHTGTPTQDGGITVERGTSDDALFQWNETTDKFEVKVGSSHATFKANALETDSLTTNSATITTLDGVTIGGTTPGVGTFTTINSPNAAITGGSITGATLSSVPSMGLADLSVTDDATINDLLVTKNDGTGNNAGSFEVRFTHPTDTSLNEQIIHTNMSAGVTGPQALVKMKNLHIDEDIQLASQSGVVKIGSAETSNLISGSTVGNFANNAANVQMYGGAIDWAHTSNTFVDADISINSDEKLVITGRKNSNYNGSAGQANTDGGIILDGKNTSASGDEHGVEIKGELTVTDTISSNLVPTTTDTFDLGSPSKVWRDIYLGPGSLYVDGQKVVSTDADGNIDITTDANENLNISAGGTGSSGDVTIFSAGATTSLNDTTVNLGPSLNTATVNVRGTLDVVNKIEMGDLDITSGKIHYDASNGNLEIETNGTGYTHLKTADAYVGASVSNALHLDENSIEVVGGSTLTLKEDVDVTGTIKIDDAFTLTAFNPYGAGNNMPVTVAGVGAEDAWAAFTIRSRGEHDFGLGSQFNLVPRGLLTLSAGRKDGSNDDYLNNNDNFGAVLFNPYSGYRTGTEWLTPSATIYGIATEDHSANGAGTKIEFASTENQNKAGAADLAHTHKHITFQGTTITSSDTLKIDDDLQVTGDIGNNGSAVDFDDNIKVTGNVSSKTTTIGDFDSSGSPAYAMSGLQLDAGDTSWPTVVFKEYAGTDGGGLKPVNLFTNPGFETEVFGGTPSSPAALGDGKRIISINGNAANGATLPGLANVRILAQTKGTQSGSNRGSELIFQTTPENSTSVSATLNIKEGNVIRIGNDSYDSGHGIIGASGGDLKLGDRLDTAGNNILNSSGDVTVDDNLKVNTNLTVDGNTVLGNANTDTITANGKLTAVNGFVNTILDTATANFLAGAGAIDEGAMAYISDGNAGSKCLAFYDSSNWKKAHSPNDNISSS